MRKAENLTKLVFVIVSYVLLGSMIIAAVSSVLLHNWSQLFLCLIALTACLLPFIIQKKAKIILPVEFIFLITLFIYLSLFLGSGFGFYKRILWWDIMLHTASGVMLGFVGFLIVYVLYESKKIRMSPFFVAMFTFCFAVALGGVWEIYEFAVDNLFGLNMQLSSLSDTMWDLIVDAFGALVAAGLGYIYCKKGKAPFFYRLTKSFIKINMPKEKLPN